MKRRMEVEIVLKVFRDVGLATNDAVKKAIGDGLKQIRREQYKERIYAKRKYEEQKYLERQKYKNEMSGMAPDSSATKNRKGAQD